MFSMQVAAHTHAVHFPGISLAVLTGSLLRRALVLGYKAVFPRAGDEAHGDLAVRLGLCQVLDVRALLRPGGSERAPQRRFAAGAAPVMAMRCCSRAALLLGASTIVHAGYFHTL